MCLSLSELCVHAYTYIKEVYWHHYKYCIAKALTAKREYVPSKKWKCVFTLQRNVAVCDVWKYVCISQSTFYEFRHEHKNKTNWIQKRICSAYHPSPSLPLASLFRFRSVSFTLFPLLPCAFNRTPFYSHFKNCWFVYTINLCWIV